MYIYDYIYIVRLVCDLYDRCLRLIYRINKNTYCIDCGLNPWCKHSQYFTVSRILFILIFFALMAMHFGSRAQNIIRLALNDLAEFKNCFTILLFFNDLLHS